VSAVVDLEQRETDVRAERDDLLAERGRVSLDAVGDDEAARAEVETIGARVSELDTELELLSLAREERARREQEAAQAAQEAAQAALSAEAERVTAQRDEAVQEALTVAETLARHLEVVLTLDASLQAAVGRGSDAFAGIRAAIVERLLLPLQDAGAQIEGPILAGRRKQLLEAWPAPTAVAQCSGCTHDDRPLIDGALAEGVTLRELEERYGLSRSSLSRHRKHAGRLTKGAYR
jgi:hypothetical protein